MNAGELRTWRKSLSLSQTAAAHALGLSLRGYQNYEDETRGKGVPRLVALACAALAVGLDEYREDLIAIIAQALSLQDTVPRR